MIWWSGSSGDILVEKKAGDPFIYASYTGLKSPNSSALRDSPQEAGFICIFRIASSR